MAEPRAVRARPDGLAGLCPARQRCALPAITCLVGGLQIAESNGGATGFTESEPISPRPRRASRTRPATSADTHQAHPSAPRKRCCRGRLPEPRRRTEPAYGDATPCCGCTAGVPARRTANGPHPHAPNPTVTPEQSAGRTAHTRPAPRRPTPSNAHEASYEQPRNPVERSFPRSSQRPTQKEGEKRDCAGVALRIVPQNTPAGVGSRSSSPSVGQCSIWRSRPRLPNQRPPLPGAGAAGGSHGSMPYRSTDRVALRVLEPDEPLWRNVLDRLRHLRHVDTNRE
jgi:hypothetical protein